MNDPELIGSDLISSVYEAAIDPARWSRVAEHLAGYLGTHQSIIAIADSLEVEPADIITHGVDPDMGQRYLELLHEDEWMLGMLQLQPNSTCVSDQFIELRQYKKRRFFQEVCAPSDVAYMGGAVVQNSRDGVLLVTAQRSARAGPFQGQDMRKVRVASDHIARAAFISRRTQALEDTVQSLRSALNKSSIGVVICDERSRVTWHNDKANDIFSKNDGLTLRFGRIKTRQPSTNHVLDTLISNVVLTSQGQGSDSGGLCSIARPSGKRPYGLTVCPVAETGAWGGSAFAVVFVVDPDSPPRMPIDAFQCLFDVTHAEARVCQSLLDGMTISEMACRFEVSENTVRTQMKSIFRKCSVRSQVDLVRLLTRTVLPV